METNTDGLRSGRLASEWDLASEDKVKYLIGIIRNFFNYLLYHEVCPEYKDQINAARTLCDKAVIEIVRICQSGFSVEMVFRARAFS